MNAPRGKGERRALLVAAEALIAERGLSKLTAAQIADHAKVSVESFRANFPDMDALLRALSLSFVDQTMATTELSTRTGIWKGAAARDVVEVAVRSIIDVVLERRALVREIVAASAREPAFAEDLQRIGTHLTNRLIAVMAECTNVPVRPSRALAFSMLLTVGLAHHCVLVGEEWSGLTFTKEQLTEEAARAITAYLGLMPTITVKDDGPDLAQTQVGSIAIGTDEILEAQTAEIPVAKTDIAMSRKG